MTSPALAHRHVFKWMTLYADGEGVQVTKAPQFEYCAICRCVPTTLVAVSPEPADDLPDGARR